MCIYKLSQVVSMYSQKDSFPIFTTQMSVIPRQLYLESIVACIVLGRDIDDMTTKHSEISPKHQSVSSNLNLISCLWYQKLL